MCQKTNLLSFVNIFPMRKLGEFEIDQPNR